MFGEMSYTKKEKLHEEDFWEVMEETDRRALLSDEEVFQINHVYLCVTTFVISGGFFYSTDVICLLQVYNLEIYVSHKACKYIFYLPLNLISLSNYEGSLATATEWELKNMCNKVVELCLIGNNKMVCLKSSHST
jgi:hypothetical protein